MSYVRYMVSPRDHPRFTQWLSGLFDIPTSRLKPNTTRATDAFTGTNEGKPLVIDPLKLRTESSPRVIYLHWASEIAD